MNHQLHMSQGGRTTFQSFARLAMTGAALFVGFAVGCASGDHKTADPGDSAASSATVVTSSSAMTTTGAPSANSLGVDTSTAPATLPTELAAVAEFGENLYDAAKAGKWAEARAIMDSLDRAARALPVGANAQSADGLELPRVLDSLSQTVTARRREAALQLANRVTYLAAKMSAGYHPQIPSDIALLDYSGRELEVWSAQRNSTMLKRTATDLRRTWDAVRPDVLRHGGTTAAEKMDSLLAQVASAKTAADYGRVAMPILNHVDVLESLYTKP